MTDITYRTTDIDTAAAVYDITGALPELVLIGPGLVEARFTDPEAPAAARKYRNDGALQRFTTAKRTIFRLIRAQG